MNAFVNDSVTVWHREWLRFIRRPARVVGSFLTPLIWMAMFGYGMQRGLQVELPFPGFEGAYLDWTAPGIVAMGMLFTGIFTGMAILFDRQFGFLKEILVAPVSRVSFVVGRSDSSGASCSPPPCSRSWALASSTSASPSRPSSRATRCSCSSRTSS